MRRRTTCIGLGLLLALVVGYVVWSFRAFYLPPKLRQTSAYAPELVQAVEEWLRTSDVAQPTPFSWEAAYMVLLDPGRDRRRTAQLSFCYEPAEFSVISYDPYRDFRVDDDGLSEQEPFFDFTGEQLVGKDAAFKLPEAREKPRPMVCEEAVVLNGREVYVFGRNFGEADWVFLKDMRLDELKDWMNR